MTELKRCPFCGGEVELVREKGDQLEFVLVSCKNCDATIGIGGSDNEQKVTEAWNTRTNPWHTGTPTEEGWYLQRISVKNKTAYTTDYYEKGGWKFCYFPRKILAWQKIEEN